LFGSQHVSELDERGSDAGFRGAERDVFRETDLVGGAPVERGEQERACLFGRE
jgi:hypothetical protein